MNVRVQKSWQNNGAVKIHLAGVFRCQRENLLVASEIGDPPLPDSQRLDPLLRIDGRVDSAVVKYQIRFSQGCDLLQLNAGKGLYDDAVMKLRWVSLLTGTKVSIPSVQVP
jgi:hypothetical protein